MLEHSGMVEDAYKVAVFPKHQHDSRPPYATRQPVVRFIGDAHAGRGRGGRRKETAPGVVHSGRGCASAKTAQVARRHHQEPQDEQPDNSRLSRTQPVAKALRAGRRGDGLTAGYEDFSADE